MTEYKDKDLSSIASEALIWTFVLVGWVSMFMGFHNEYFVLRDLACAGLAPPAGVFFKQVLFVAILFCFSVSLPVSIGIAIIKGMRKTKSP
ncbi:hypothetical protein [uncultured Methanolobus sp.]|uniref:hypothetical protein n=1 Tax=uncultured Methanolobus sp. TaxID=218300 RepID=UPI0029C7EA0F|nr:hypothetical protein [uncultured Methanolobus sp.]